jgi:hypothetical protein
VGPGWHTDNTLVKTPEMKLPVTCSILILTLEGKIHYMSALPVLERLYG